MKKKYIIVIPFLAVLISLLIVFFYFYNINKSTTLSISEKRWIENNQKTIIDIEILNNYPVYGTDGTGVFFDLIDDIENHTDLKFNQIPTLLSDDTTSEYSIKALNNEDELSKNDLLLFVDSYVAISTEEMSISSEKDINNLKLGVLNSDLSETSYYLKSSKNLEYTTYENTDDLFKALDNKNVDLIIVPYIMNLDRTISNNKYFINFYFTDFSKKIVLNINGKDKTLNNILKKEFNYWKNNNYVEEYNQELLEYYIQSNNISDKTKTDLVSKTYVYGYVENTPYEVTKGSSVEGIAMEYINRMSRLTNIEFKYKKYKTVNALKKDIADNKVDIYFDYYGINSKNYKSTISPFIEEYVVLGKLDENNVITSFEAMKDKNIKMLANDSLTKYFENNSRAIVTKVNNINKLKIKDNELLVVDSNVYNYYKNSKFSKYQVLYQDKMTNNYKFNIKKDNTTFYNLFNYIINTNSYYKYRNAGLLSLNTKKIDNSSFIKVFTYIFVIILLVLTGTFIFILIHKKNKKVKEVKKEERVKYTDLLTSLKNRNYLNLNIASWDECKVLPQSIIIVDLNNVQYVNDNHGYEAGDELIVKAASVLVNTQLEKSEIIRTDGNEFLIYTIGYSESQIETYTKKLNKELKKLPYGFGACIGYSMIKDDIKTIDDAISEATLEMKTKKEDYK
ncbi:MAG: diguanylate cyclase domain-containing protein [Bacilli bacterium]